MIEPIMYAAIGFLTATLLALLVLPAVWRRAVRLTRRRVENAIPVTLAEIQADKDEQRAEFAVETRRLELEVDRHQARAAELFADVTRRDEELRARKASLDEALAGLQDLQSRHDSLTRKDVETSESLALRERELEETRARLAATLAELATARQDLDETTSRENELKIEHVALTTERGTLHGRVAELERLLAATNAHLETERTTLRATSESLSVEVTSNRDLKTRLAETENELGTVSAEAAALRAEVAALSLRADSLEQRTRSAEARRDAAETDAREVTGSARAAQASAEAAARQANDAAEMVRAEKAMLEGALAKAREDRAELQKRLDALIPTAAGVPEDVDDGAQLRERISDIAAEVAALTAALEGPGSPIDALLAAAPAGKRKKNNPLPLADRIRALQEKAAKAGDAGKAADSAKAPTANNGAANGASNASTAPAERPAQNRAVAG
ncbi:hypothetical protein [Ancylobacter mangrovi]|uniref:hypothetical protein n=1 Tax=Ancylobacter mangrovi TaxID=2972472 RepID=UPI002162FA7D|nr:hypothetical protein [Ancylobacter mangrovi]MCS0504414.1 hypothetical protein [Ancylobacter mangrovi]